MSGWQNDRIPIPSATRKAVLKRDRFCVCKGCSACSRQGCQRESTDADHDPITYRNLVRQGVSDPNSVEYLKGKCSPCHAVKSRLEQVAGVKRMKYRREPMKHPGELREK